jgi:hypothetical protein
MDTPSLLPNYLRFKETGPKSCLPGGLASTATLSSPWDSSPAPRPVTAKEVFKIRELPLDFGTPNDLFRGGLDRSGSPEVLKVVRRKGRS